MLEKKALQLSWHEVSFAIQQEIESILHKDVPCEASWDDESYWSVIFTRECLSVSEIRCLIESVGSSPKLLIENVENSEEPYPYGIGMMLSHVLLKRNLGFSWEAEVVTEDSLTLVGITESTEQASPVLYLNGNSINLDSLKSKEELLSFLEENGANHAALMDSCEEYREQYQDELCWDYPISDGLHLGTFLVLVREGLLSLPYDSADSENYEHFCLEDVKIFDEDTLHIFLTDWKSYSNGLCRFMAAIKGFLQAEAN